MEKHGMSRTKMYRSWMDMKQRFESKTGYVGVRYKAGKYQAEVTRYGKYYYIGRYDTPEKANAARIKFVEAGGWF